jgi:hypothetical protein
MRSQGQAQDGATVLDKMLVSIRREKKKTPKIQPVVAMEHLYVWVLEQNGHQCMEGKPTKSKEPGWGSQVDRRLRHREAGQLHKLRARNHICGGNRWYHNNSASVDVVPSARKCDESGTVTSWPASGQAYNNATV